MTEFNLVGLLFVSLGGGLGACLRFLVDGWTTRRLDARGRNAGFGWGIGLVNLTGSRAMGIVAGLVFGASSQGAWASIAMVGILGGYTTFSTASIDTVRLLNQRRFLAAGVHASGMLVLSVACVLAGLALVS